MAIETRCQNYASGFAYSKHHTLLCSTTENFLLQHFIISIGVTPGRVNGDMECYFLK